MGKLGTRLFLAALPVALLGCSSHAPQVVPRVTYLVTAHNSAANTWAVVATDPTNKTRITYVLACDFYKWGSREAVKGPDACDLQVGESIATEISAQRFVEVYNLGGNNISIVTGRGEDRVHQQFTIKSAKMLPYKAGT